jgi:hypothetical protein
MKASDYFNEQDLHSMRSCVSGGGDQPLRKAIARRVAELDRQTEPPRIVSEGDFSKDVRGVCCERAGVRWVLKLLDSIRSES